MAFTELLRSRIISLRDRLKDDLRRSAIYYLESKTLWERFFAEPPDGPAEEFSYPISGYVSSRSTVADNGLRYVGEQLPHSVLFQSVSAFESFLFDLMAEWLVAFPASLGKKTVAVKTILETPTREGIIDEIVRKELIEIAYDKPAVWFEYLRTRTGAALPTEEQITRIAEAKATRDVLLHNRGIVNALYITKSVNFARYPVGEVLHVPEQYLAEVMSLLTTVSQELCDSLAGDPG